MREVDRLAVSAAKCRTELDDFIQGYVDFIIKAASSTANRYITKNDDEWSIALSAFTEAIFSYDFEKGSFLSFAGLIIERRLIDYFRTEQKRRQAEIVVNPDAFEHKFNQETEDIAIGLEVMKKVSHRDDNSLKLEIESANHSFARYGFSFMDLIACSPKAEKTKLACARTVCFLLDNPLLISEMRSSRTLPLSILEKRAKIPRKLLERHRRYLIAVTEILYGDYPYLSEYLEYVRKEC